MDHLATGYNTIERKNSTGITDKNNLPREWYIVIDGAIKLTLVEMDNNKRY